MTSLGKPNDKTQAWCKEHYKAQPTGKFAMKTVNGNSYEFDASDEQIAGQLNYQYKYYSIELVSEPYASNPELANPSNLLAVEGKNCTLSSIGSQAFYGCPNLTSLECSFVSAIGDHAFTKSKKLKEVKFDPNLISIGYYAFVDCSSLTSIDCHNLTSLERQTFIGCLSLSSVNIPKAESIGDYCFSGCTGLSSVVLSGISDPSKVTALGSLALYNCAPQVSVFVKNAEMSSAFCNDSTWKEDYADGHVKFIAVE